MIRNIELESYTKGHLIASIGAAIAAFALVLTMTSLFGIGLSPDSACYISIAENLVKGNGYAIYDLRPAVAWPPLYPTILAGAGLFNIEYHFWARLLNSFLAAAIVLITALWLFRNFGSGLPAATGILGTLFASSLLLVIRFAWTETLFILFVLLFLFKVLRSDRTPILRDIISLAIIAALATMTRYIGVTLIGFYLLWIWHCNFSVTTKTKFSLIFSGLSLMPLILWLWRNYNITETLTGTRVSSSVSLFKNILYSLDTFSNWILPMSVPADTRITILCVLAIVFVIFLTRHIIRSNISNEALGQLKVFGLFAALYVSYLVIVSTVVAFDRINERLLAPVYIPILLFLITGLNSMKQQYRKLKVAVVSLAVLWIGFLSFGAYSDVRVAVTDGAGGYSSVLWQNSELAGYLKENPPPGRTYSNIPDGMYALTGLGAWMAPRKHYYRSPESLANDLEWFKEVLVKEETVYLAWFRNKERRFLYRAEELVQHFELQEIASKSDGSLYKISIKPPDN